MSGDAKDVERRRRLGDAERLRAARTRFAAAQASGIGAEQAGREVKVLGTFAALDALGDRRRQQTRMAEARREALAAGRDPEQAARLAAPDPDEPRELAATVTRRRALDAALAVGRITPAERGRFERAMDADEAAAIRLLERMPEGRVPLEAKAQVWGQDEMGPPLPPSGALPRGWSLLSAGEQVESAARRR